jgi:hypothetical protein
MPHPQLVPDGDFRQPDAPAYAAQHSQLVHEGTKGNISAHYPLQHCEDLHLFVHPAKYE